MRTTSIESRPAYRANVSWPALLVLSLTSLFAFLIALQPIDFLVRHLKDDSYYYFRTANHIALGHGPTFDGISLTNGFHPLWMLNLIPVYSLFPHAPLVALRVVVLILALYHTLTAWMLYCIARRFVGNVAACCIALAWALCPFVLRISFSGMEAALYGVVLAALIWCVVVRLKLESGAWNAAASLRSYAGAGCWSGCAYWRALTRCTSLLGCAPRLAWPRCDKAARAAVRALLALLMPVAALAGPYLLYNWFTFHHLMPVSGLVKRPVLPASPAELGMLLLWPFSPLTNRVGFGPLLVTLVLLSVGAISILVASPRMRSVTVPVLRRYDWLWVGTALLYAHISISKTFIANWYYVPFALLMALAFGEIAVRAMRMFVASRRMQQILGAALLTLIFVGYGLIATAEFNPHKNDQVYATYQAALWLKANTPPIASGGAWNAGVLAYFSERQVMNLDGLINSYDYLTAMQCGQDAAFAVQHGVDYVCDMYPLTDDQSTDFTPGPQWTPYLKPYYEQRFQARNVGLSSFFQTVFLKPRSDATFLFKVWKVKN